MANLLRAGLSRLKKDRVFHLAVLLVILLATLMTVQTIGSYRGDARLGLVMGDMEEYFFSQAPLMGILTAVFVSLFWGAEYSDGAIRSKLCVGHRRGSVYLSHFTLCLAANLTLLGLWMLCCSPLYFFIGPMEMGLAGFLTYAATAVCFTAAFTAVYTLLCAMVTNRAYSVVLALGLWALMQMTASGLYDRLCEPEINGPHMSYVGGEMVLSEAAPNPLYISGSLRLFLEMIVEALPTGQTLLVTDVNIWNPARGILLSLAFTGIMLALGLCFFRKKDIR